MLHSPLLEAMRFACADGQCGLHQEVRACDRCPTDYRVVFKDREVTLYVWQDLGAGTSPADPYWRRLCGLMTTVRSMVQISTISMEASKVYVTADAPGCEHKQSFMISQVQNTKG